MSAPNTLAPLNSAAFTEFVQANPLSVVVFTAPWCSSCPQIKRNLETASQELPWAAFAQVDVDQEPELAQNQGIMAAGTIIVYKQGAPVDQVVGARPPRQLVQIVQAAA